MKKILLLLIVMAGFSLSLAAQKVVTGKVTDADLNPLGGVSVLVKGTTVGTLTDAEGKFSLSVPAEARVLSFSFIGMKSSDLEMGNRTNFDVVMSVDVGLLDEVIVIGYGTVKKRDLTGAVTRINAEELQTEASTNVTSMLRGAIPGLSVGFNITPKGISNPRDLLIRGETSLRADDTEQANANAPLVVVDGMIYYGDLADINPVDIETFDILKDASSAAIYGARASNGVILITTKKGRQGKPIINISTSTGMAYISPAHFDLMNGEQFIARRKAGFEANERNQVMIGAGYYNSPDDLPSGVTLDQWKAYDGSSAATDLIGVWLNRIGFAAVEIDNYQKGKETDFSKYTWQTGFTQDYNLSVSGSSREISYYLSLGYANNEGIRYNESFNTIRSRLNLEANITDWLKVGTNTQIAFRDESPIVIGRSFYNTPYSSMYEDDGVTLTFSPSGYVNAPNFWYELLYHDQFIKYNTMNSKIYGTIAFPFGITFTSEFIPRFNWNRNYQSWSTGHPNWAVEGGRAARQNTTIFEWQVNNMLKWNKTFGPHAFDVTLVQNAEKYQYWRDYMYRRRFLPSDVLGYHRMQAGSEDMEISSDDQYSTGDALLARLNYTLRSRYNFTGSFRRDGYSAFGQKNPHAYFWSLAGGWTISEESFFDIPWIDQLKLRFSYGTNGNRGVGIYDALSDLGTGKYVMITGGSPGYTSLLYTNRMANSSLKWERTGAFNIGLDFAILKGRLSGNVEGYYMITKDLLIPRQLPNITGYASVMSNLGQVDNKGMELTLNSVNIANKNFTWSTDLSLAHNRNKIVHLYGDYATDPLTGESKELDDIINQWFIGHAIDQIWDYKTLGIWQQDESAEAAAYSRSPGDYKLEDLNDDGYYTNADKQFQGYRRPVVRLTLRNDFSYKNFELSVKMYSNLGHYRENNYVRNNEAFYDRSTYYNVPYWTPENPGNTWARIDSYETGFNVWQNNSFVRFDNISLSYAVPQKFLNRFKIASCRLSVVSENTFVIAPGWSWMDPEYNDYSPSYLSFKVNITL
ncbi:MAG TPA: SusC/RagA family TonB-linked outer membrane protein [Bacteroidales bacterium]|nr:SusC/RagA family TonB-linked outer membrane protein [Bacteroidales bacterium]